MRIAINIMDHTTPASVLRLLKLLISICLFSLSACTSNASISEPREFNQNRAFSDLEYQVNLGPRIVGSDAHQHEREWLLETTEQNGWVVESQSLNYSGQDIHNIIAKRDNGKAYPWVIIGAHYDSRIVADQDPLVENRTKPVPGANDGASGVAVLNELARVIPSDLKANIWLVYFDAEDNGSLPGGEWSLGSRAFVEHLDGKPDAVVIVDMVADRDLNILIEKNSDVNLVNEIWEVADSLGYDQTFINQPKYRMIDDHLPFIQAGIPAAVIIDFDYPYWHTISDTPDKVSAESLGIVGEVVLEWLFGKIGETH